MKNEFTLKSGLSSVSGVRWMTMVKRTNMVTMVVIPIVTLSPLSGCTMKEALVKYGH